MKSFLLSLSLVRDEKCNDGFLCISNTSFILNQEEIYFSALKGVNSKSESLSIP